MAKLTWDSFKKAAKSALGMTLFSSPTRVYTSSGTKNTTIGGNNKSRSTDYGTAIGPTQDGGNLATPKLQEYPSTGSSYSGGYGGSSGSTNVSAQSIYDANLDAYQKAYDAAVNAAKNANTQNIKSLNDAIARTREDIARDRDEYNKYYDTQASNLLKSIERFRESNAQNVADQRRAYLTNQAALESARAEADRQSRISAAARGLGGSGLQQLSQLQNLINQSQDISKVATENQTNMDKLRQALAQAEEDYSDNLKESESSRKSDLDRLSSTLRRAEEDYTTNVNNANENLRDLLAQYEATRANNNVNALSDLYSRVNATSGSGSGSSYASDLDIVVGGLDTIQNNFAYDAAEIMGNRSRANTSQTKQLKALYNTESKKAREYTTNYGNTYSNAVNTNINNLKSILKSYGVNV